MCGAVHASALRLSSGRLQCVCKDCAHNDACSISACVRPQNVRSAARGAANGMRWEWGTATALLHNEPKWISLGSTRYTVPRVPLRPHLASNGWHTSHTPRRALDGEPQLHVSTAACPPSALAMSVGAHAPTKYPSWRHAPALRHACPPPSPPARTRPARAGHAPAARAVSEPTASHRSRSISGIKIDLRDRDQQRPRGRHVWGSYG